MSYNNNPPFSIPAYVTVATSGYSQLTNQATSSLVNFYVLTSIFSTVFFDSLQLIPCYNIYKQPGKNWSIYNDTQTTSTNDPSTNQILSQLYPDTSVTPASGSAAYNLAALNSTVSGHTTSIAANSSAITALQSSVSTNSSNITSLQSSVSANTTNISTNATNIATLQTQLAALALALTNFGLVTSAGTPAVYSQVSGTKPNSQIATNQTNIATLTTDIGYIKSDVNANVTVANNNATTYNNLTTTQLLAGTSKPAFTNQSSISQF